MTIRSGSAVEYGHVQTSLRYFPLLFETFIEILHTVLTDENYDDFLERLDWAMGVMFDEDRYSDDRIQEPSEGGIPSSQSLIYSST